MNKELRRCPFCGGEADTLCAVGFFAVPINKVYCMECGALVEGYSNEVDAIEAWNRRKPLEDIVKQLEEAPHADELWVWPEDAIRIVKGASNETD